MDWGEEMGEMDWAAVMDWAWKLFVVGGAMLLSLLVLQAKEPQGN